uniref:Uncharacterized protein n=1 Tax=Triticum urartu TaxID=4572 RepID=A0A8R7UPT2_TRIUA
MTKVEFVTKLDMQNYTLYYHGKNAGQLRTMQS